MEQLCKKCDQVLPQEARVCSCGHPTSLATFKERTEYELREWRSYQARAKSDVA